MRPEDINDGMGKIDKELIEETDRKRRMRKKKNKFLPLVAVLALIIIGGYILKPYLMGEEVAERKEVFALAEAEYPDLVDYPDEEEYMKKDNWEELDKAYDKWEQSQTEFFGKLEKVEGINPFFQKVNVKLLTGLEENRVYSPLNVYLASAMMAETAAGETREEILDLLASDSIEKVRENSKNLWLNSYQSDGRYESLLANSLWLDEGKNYNEKTVEILKNDYFASSYAGKMGSDEYNKAFQEWLNENTEGLLEDSVSEQKFEEDTNLALASTIYFQANWDWEFRKENNYNDIFHSPNGDVEVEFMKKVDSMKTVYFDEDFMAINEPFSNRAGQMWFFLPDEDKSVDDILNGEGMLKTINYENEGSGHEVHYSIPKFDIVSDMDLVDTFKELGVESAFDFDLADFSNISEEEIAVDKINHSVRTKIDEEGFVGAGFVTMALAGAAEPEEYSKIEFKLDRPFIFVVTNSMNNPLFIGVVNKPNE